MATAEKEVEEVGTQFYVDLDDVYIDPGLNTRQVVDTEEEMVSFAASIESTNGLLQPIGIYKTPKERRTEHGKDYELGFGFRRCAALAHLAETTGEKHWVEHVAAIMKEEASFAQRQVEQLIENLQRSNLGEMEIALAFKDTLDAGIGLTQKSLAQRIGWPESTLSNYLAVAKNLVPAVQQLVIDKHLGWAHAKEMSRLNLPADQQEAIAKIGSGSDYAKFKKHLDDTYKSSEASGDEATTTTEDKAGTQKNQISAVRTNLLREKYIPRLEEALKAAKGKEKEKQEVRLDTLKFVLNIQGTQLGAELAPWEKELEEKKASEETEDERRRNRTKYIRTAITFIDKAMKEIPPIDAPTRNMKTLPEALEQVKLTVQADLQKGKDNGLEENTMVQGFKVDSVDVFVEEISTEFGNYKKKKAEIAAANKLKKEKEAEEAKAKEKDKAASVNPEVSADAGGSLNRGDGAHLPKTVATSAPAAAS